MLVKDDSSRFGLPAFKVLGASWAVWRRLSAHLGAAADHGSGWAPLRQALQHHPRVTLIAASEGNHGRAVAWVARQLGIGARIFLPAAATAADAIRAEGAEVVFVNGSYDAAVAAAERSASQQPHRLLIADVATHDSDDVPGWVIDGYGTMFTELADHGAGHTFDAVFVPAGVGALTAAAVRYFARIDPAARIVAVEPLHAACILASMRQGTRVSLSEVGDSVLVGLNCGTPSAAAWPDLLAGLHAVVAVSDERAVEASAILGEAGLALGVTGAAACAGLLEATTGPSGAVLREGLGLDAASRVLLVATEARTEPGGTAGALAGSNAAH